MVKELLKIGKENATSTENLLAKSGLTSKRALQKMIAKERNAGAVILSSYSGGYYLPGCPAEVAEFVRAEDKKARSTMQALKSARMYLKQIQPEGQIEIASFE